MNKNPNIKILVSSCLCGKCTRYDGGCKPIKNKIFSEWQSRGMLVSVCPEVLGGLSTPRPPAEINNNRVINTLGEDVSDNFINGANLALKTALSQNTILAILKDNSPSCGSKQIYDGTFSGKKINGSGIFAKLLKDNGIRIFTETEIEKAADFLENFSSHRYR